LLILADLHDEWRKLDRIEAMLSGELPLPSRLQTNGSAPALSAPSTPSAAPARAGVGPALLVETILVASNGSRPAEAPSGPSAAAVFRRERLILGIGLLLAVAVLFGSWARAANVDAPKPAIAATGVAVFGLVLVALGAVGSTLTVKRHVQLRKARVFAPFLDCDDDAIAAPAAAGSLVVAPGLTRYHRAECRSVAGLAVRSVDGRDVPGGLAPCHLCDADAAE
jgi:hypothetical protein